MELIDESVEIAGFRIRREAAETSQSIRTEGDGMRKLLLPVGLLAALLAATAPGAGAGVIDAFTEQVSPEAETNATEPSVAVDRSDGTVWVAWQASGTHVARSDDGGRGFVQTPIVDFFGRDLGDVHVR